MQRGRIILGVLFVLVFPQVKADLTRAEDLAEFKTLYAKYTNTLDTHFASNWLQSKELMHPIGGILCALN